MKHRRAYEEARGTGAARGYDGAWRGLRAAYLRQHPRCSEPGCSLPSTDADHVIPIRVNPVLRLEWKNLRAYCHAHHSAKTVREDGGLGRGRA